MPTLKLLMLRVPEPWPMVAVPSVVDPSLKVMVPVALDGVTVAVRVVDWPAAVGFSEDRRVVVVLA